jgi:hypothetical protein
MPFLKERAKVISQASFGGAPRFFRIFGIRLPSNGQEPLKKNGKQLSSQGF